MNIFTIDKYNIKTDCIDGPISNGIKRLKHFSFLFDESTGFKKNREPETELSTKKTFLDYTTFSL